MTNFIVKSAYRIEGSKTYHSFRTFLVNILLNHNTKHKKIFDILMIFLVISTVGILIYEVKNPLPPFIDHYEYFAIVIFILEWLCRVFVSFESHKQIIKDFEESQFLNMPYNIFSSIKIITNEKFKYILSLASIIDLLAILPSYRPLRILRIFLLFRLFKILRYSNSISQFARVFIEKKLELSILLLLYLLVIFFCSTILYIYEGTGLNEKVVSFSDALYWAFITVSTIGYGDITPISDAGRFTTLILIFTGYSVIAFFTAIITSSISDKLDIIKESKAISNTSKLNNFTLVCGYGKAGTVLVTNLLNKGYEVLIIEPNANIAQSAELKNLNIIKNDASDISLLKDIGIINNVKSVVVLTDDDTINLSIILAVRSLNSEVPIISRCNRYETQDKLKLAGATKIIGINESSALVTLGFLKSPIAFEAIDEILIDYKGATMNEIEIYENSAFIGEKLSSVDFKKFNINFIGIVHGNDKSKFTFNPKTEDIVLKQKDFLIIIGYEKTIKDFKTYIQSKQSKRG